MKLITLDFETYYGPDYSLSSMTTEDYVRDPRFDTMLVSVKVDRGVPRWFSGGIKQTGEWLKQFDIPNNALLCHHMAFDGLILQHHYGTVPKLYLDTRLMAQAKYKPFTGSASLKACMQHAALGLEKGDEVASMYGRPRASLDKAELTRYAGYCSNDTECTYALFQQLKLDYPAEELHIIDLTLRMYLEPQFTLDVNLLAEHLQEVKAKKEAVQQRVASMLTTDDLMSNNKFADILRSLGCEPPMKTSPTTGKPTYALAKNDQAFKDFIEEYADDEIVAAICAARTATKSTLEETRTTRLLAMGLLSPLLRIPLLYYAAHTGRYGGTEKINMQNLPQPHKSRIRFALRAPVGHVVVGADLSQIEARLACTLAGETKLVSAFRAGRDVYAEFGSRVYGRTITRADVRERFLSKTAVLGLQYGMGAQKYVGACRALGDVKVEELEAMKVVSIYRDTYTRIPALWRELDRCIDIMAEPGATYSLGPVRFKHHECVLPNGMSLYYPELTRTDAGWQYLFGREVRSLWGGKLLENIVQALARIVVMQQMLRIRSKLGYRPALQVHDELDYIVRAVDAGAFAESIRPIMTAPISWMPEAPIDVEIHSGATFGDCK